jgi:hypothetical protein
MSRIFGPARQLGYVVHDIEAAMRHWTDDVGVGPFFYFEKVGMRDYRYLGESYAIELSIALSYSGDIQIELIQQRNAVPSLYLDRLRDHGEVLHHVSAWSTDYDHDRQRIIDAGHTPVQEARIGTNRLAYFSTGQAPHSTVFELYDVSGKVQGFNERIRLAAQDWDGTDPIRRLA